MVVSNKPDDLGALWHVEDDTMEQRLQASIKGRKAFKSQQEQQQQQ
jgi:hypothetical protein